MRKLLPASADDRARLTRAIERRFGKSLSGYTVRPIGAVSFRITDTESGSWIEAECGDRLRVTAEHDGAALPATTQPTPVQPAQAQDVRDAATVLGELEAWLEANPAAMVPHPVQPAQARDTRSANSHLGAILARRDSRHGMAEPFAGAVHDFSRPMCERAESRRHCGPYLWAPSKPGTGRGFYMQDGRGALRCADHGAGFRLRVVECGRGHCFDDFGGCYTGIVLRLPRGRGFLVGATMGAGMSSFFDADIWDDEADAMRAADDAAESAAAQQQAFEERERVELEADDFAEYEAEGC